MLCAYERVVKNAGVPGVKGLTVSALKPWLVVHWPKVRQVLLAGEYMPAAVRKVKIPKLQGGSLSPLLSNILLEDLDRELERRGHRFCRYADDCNIYAGSHRTGQRVMQSITAFLEQRLKLKVNACKSAVARPWQRKFLGYSMTWHRKPKLKIAPQSRPCLVEKIRQMQRQARGQSLKTSHRAAQSDPARLDGLLPAHRSERCSGRTRRLDQA